MKNDLTRRDVLKIGAAGGIAGLAACATGPGTTPESRDAPAIFISHGSPMEALAKDAYTDALLKMGRDHASLRAVVIISAHWVEPLPVRVGTAAMPETIYDFGGFPKALYEIKYPAPGDPVLATDIVGVLRKSGFDVEPDAERGLDHGAWAPMRLAWPDAKVPVVQVTLPSTYEPADLFKMGQALAPLRARGVAILGSGGIVHNFDAIAREKDAPAAPWARTFDAWVRENVERRDYAKLLDYRKASEHAELAAPTTEHFDPLFVVLGSASKSDRVRDIYDGFFHGNIGMRSFLLRA